MITNFLIHILVLGRGLSDRGFRHGGDDYPRSNAGAAGADPRRLRRNPHRPAFRLRQPGDRRSRRHPLHAGHRAALRADRPRRPDPAAIWPRHAGAIGQLFRRLDRRAAASQADGRHRSDVARPRPDRHRQRRARALRPFPAARLRVRHAAGRRLRLRHRFRHALHDDGGYRAVPAYCGLRGGDDGLRADGIGPRRRHDLRRDRRTGFRVAGRHTGFRHRRDHELRGLSGGGPRQSVFRTRHAAACKGRDRAGGIKRVRSSSGRNEPSDKDIPRANPASASAGFIFLPMGRPPVPSETAGWVWLCENRLTG